MTRGRRPSAVRTRRVGAVVVATVAVAALTAATAVGATSGDTSRASRHSTATGSITVTGHGARAVIQRHPFRLRIEDGHGTTVLSEVANTKQAPQVLAPTTDPIAPGYDKQSTGALYAPLSFLVGTEDVQQYPAGEWVGNLDSGTRSGTEYSARDVRSATRIGSGVRLVLSTSDPSGRTLIVTVTRSGSSAMRVSVTPSNPTGVAMLGDSFASTRHEGFFGFGGRHDALDQHGQVLSSFVNEENLAGKVGPVQGPGGLSMFPNGADAAYYPQAEFYSSRSYGFLLDQPQLARFSLDADHPAAWNVTASTPRLDYVVAPGAPPRAVRTITHITGRQPVAPHWALGPMLDRLVKNNTETYADYESKLRDDLRNIDRYKLPLSAYRIEGWGFPGSGNDGLALHTYVHPAAQAHMVKALRRRGIHPLFYLRPWLTPGSAPVKKGYAVTDANGKPYAVTGSGGSQFDLVDFTNPAAVRFWQHEVAKVFNLGADGFMQDYGEQVLFDMHFHNGSTGVTEHSRYLTQYARATRQEITRYQHAHPHRHPWFFTRAGYTGDPGNAAYEGGNFPGDETTDWGHASGIKSLASDMLNRAVGGAYGYGTDIGGYLDYTTPATTKQLFIRWAQWAVFSPIFRLHGTGLAGTHTPWSYDHATVKVYEHLSRLHEKAAPLIRRLWQAADSRGTPVTRPLWFQDIHDRKGWTQDQEWLLGRNLLAAPVVDQGAHSRHVYLPPGHWRLRGAGHTYTGGRSVTVHASLRQLPYFIRAGHHPLG